MTVAGLRHRARLGERELELLRLVALDRRARVHLARRQRDRDHHDRGDREVDHPEVTRQLHERSDTRTRLGFPAVVAQIDRP